MATSWMRVMVAVAVVCFAGGADAAGRSLLQTTCANPALPDVNLPQYLGVWYAIAITSRAKSIASSSVECITARYSLMTDYKTIRVHNQGYNQSSGEYTSLIGTATVSGRSLRVHFPSRPEADYRIIYLGGDAKDRYRTAVVYSCDVGQASGFQSLFIYSRKPYLIGDESVAGLVNIARRQGITLEANNQPVIVDNSDYTCGRYSG